MKSMKFPKEHILTLCTCAFCFVVTYLFHLREDCKIDIWSFGVGYFCLLWFPYFIMLPDHCWLSYVMVVCSCAGGGFLYWLWQLDWQTNTAMTISTLSTFKCQRIHEHFVSWRKVAVEENIEMGALQAVRETNIELRDARDRAEAAEAREQNAEDRVRALEASERASEAREQNAEARARASEARERAAQANLEKYRKLLAEALRSNEAKSNEVDRLIGRMNTLSVNQVPSD
uniref:Uncharacterized protein n=1 Tax=Ditylenchus dipsaci TaxID=166011 RepID=A0A915DAZ8_9BILA